jgi:transcriptional/translational regulatory protein YebC/TACO1
MEMIKKVENSKEKILNNAIKRKFEEAKKEKEEKDILVKMERIKKLKDELEHKKHKLKQKRHEMENYKVYSDFLEDVVNADSENKEFGSQRNSLFTVL